MKQIVCLAIICILVQPIISEVFRENPEAGGPTDKCRPRTYNIGDMSFGETKQVPGKCLTATCGRDRVITYNGCPSVAAAPSSKCQKVNADFSKSHPDCCAKFKC